MFVWDISPIMLTLGPIQVRYYGLLFAVMMIGGYYLWQWQMLRGGHTQQQAEGFFLWGAIAVIGGSRLGQVLFYDPARYLANPGDPRAGSGPGPLCEASEALEARGDGPVLHVRGAGRPHGAYRELHEQRDRGPHYRRAVGGEIPPLRL